MLQLLVDVGKAALVSTFPVTGARLQTSARRCASARIRVRWVVGRLWTQGLVHAKYLVRPPVDRLHHLRDTYRRLHLGDVACVGQLVQL